MAVRFLPPPGDAERSPGEDRPDLAEVIEFRSALQQRRWLDSSAEDASEEAPAADAGRAVGPGDEDAKDRAPARAHGHPAPALRSARSLLEGESAGSDDSARHESPGTGPHQSGEVILASFAGHPDQEDRESHQRFADRMGEEYGADLGESELDPEPEEAGPERSCSEDGVRLLARRARSSGELRAELSALGHSGHEVEVTIAEFEESCYLDDDGLARALAEKLRDSKRASRAQIRRKLRERRLADEAIESAIGELDDHEEFTLLKEAAQQRANRLAGLDRQVAERRLLGFLARRGWSGEPAVRAAREALDAAGRPAGGVRFR